MTTLPQILWSDLDADPNGNGHACPCDTPAVGLPYRLAAFLLAEGLQHFSELEAIDVGDHWVWGIQPGRLTPVVSRSFVVAMMWDRCLVRSSGINACPLDDDMHLKA